MQSQHIKTGRTIIARFDEGEDLLDPLKACAVKHNIKSGWFSVIGGLKEATFGLYENGSYKIIKKTAHHCLELLPTIGNFATKENDILVHAHLTITDEEGTAFGGHLLNGCIIFPFAEVVIQEFQSQIVRRYAKKTNLWPFKFD